MERAAAGFVLELGWPGPRGVEALISVLRPSFHVRNLDRLYTPQSMAARVELGGEVRFE